MKKLILIVLSTFSFGAKAQTLWQINKDTVITYYYTYGDEFSGSEISKEQWNSWYGWARSITSNKEQQYYSDYKNHEVKNGCLYLTTEKKDLDARLVDWMGDSVYLIPEKFLFLILWNLKKQCI